MNQKLSKCCQSEVKRYPNQAGFYWCVSCGDTCDLEENKIKIKIIPQCPLCMEEIEYSKAPCPRCDKQEPSTSDADIKDQTKPVNGYAILNKDTEILFVDYYMTEVEMRNWYRNQLEQGCELAKITIQII